MKNNHIPERMCVVCREKKMKQNLFRLAKEDNSYIYDATSKIQARGIYVCKDSQCLLKLSKHKKIKIPMSELMKLSDELKKSKKDYISILKTMARSNYLSFGMAMVLEEIEKTSLLFIAKDISEKNKERLIRKCVEKKIDYIELANKRDLGIVFGKDEINVIGVLNKKVARGLLNL